MHFEIVFQRESIAMYIHCTSIEGCSREGSAKKYTNKICRDNRIHGLYIPTLAFLDYIMHLLMSTPIQGSRHCCLSMLVLSIESLTLHVGDIHIYIYIYIYIFIYIYKGDSHQY
jgi:hypothetical protein